ncbi:dTMP kinase [Altererythrobacter salegens]|uniref:Thymidylate kinase n=1 Tax=Croceibacterium salegens TaxID=1737568 RepID=A0A6I4SSK7_9SPHN|nr:dTMP kinase [Croceibacterium salegens]MXO58855.1 dTMP kinase [Croceibacterium salegens]
MAQGRFIALEGGEGTGKSTQSRLLANYLQEQGLEVATTREPGGTPGAEAIRHLLLDPSGDGWEAEAEALLFAAARSDHVARLIRPALERGAWVVSDRFLDSSRAYQGGGGGLTDDAIMDLHRFGSRGLLPDLTILIDVPDDAIAERLARRDGGESDRIGGRDAAFHRRVKDAFVRFADRELGRFATIDGSGDVEATHAAIVTAIEPLLAIR